MTGYQKSHERVNLFNLAIEENSTVDEIADMIIEKLSLKKVNRKYTGGPRGWIGDNPLVHLSIDKIKSFGWIPHVTSKQAIGQTISWSIKNQISRKI